MEQIFDSVKTKQNKIWYNQNIHAAVKICDKSTYSVNCLFTKQEKHFIAEFVRDVI